MVSSSAERDGQRLDNRCARDKNNKKKRHDHLSPPLVIKRQKTLGETGASGTFSGPFIIIHRTSRLRSFPRYPRSASRPIREHVGKVVVELRRCID